MTGRAPGRTAARPRVRCRLLLALVAVTATYGCGSPASVDSSAPAAAAPGGLPSAGDPATSPTPPVVAPAASAPAASPASPAASATGGSATGSSGTSGSGTSGSGTPGSAVPAVPRDVTVPAPGTAAPPLPADLRPVRVQVPALGIDSALITLGVQADGTLEVPADPDVAGWADRSPAPGQRGPSVIAGHVDSRTGPAVFYRLAELKAGDQVVVTQADGERVRFTVDGVERYPKDAFPTAAVYGPVPGPVLRLITCGGLFDPATGHYRDNVVAYASATG